METNAHGNAWWFWGEGWSRFGAFAVVGATLILAAHALFPEARWPIAVFAVLLMAAFGYSEWPYKKGQEDRLGDDLYYLGLTYTLVSVAHALYAFTSVANVDRLVSDFSVALLTTLVGIVGRVLLYEKHASPKAPAEMDEGMVRLRAEIEGAVGQMQQFRRGLALNIQQASDTALKGVDTAFASFTTSANQMSEAAKVVNASLRKGTSAFDKSFARVGEASQALGEHVSALAEGTKALGSVSEALNGQMGLVNASLKQQSLAVAANVDAQNEITRRVGANLDFLNRPVSLLAGSIEEMRQQVDAAKQDFSSAQLSQALSEHVSELAEGTKALGSVSEALNGQMGSLNALFEQQSRAVAANVDAQNEITRRIGANLDSLNRPVSLLAGSIEEMRQQVDAAKQDFGSAQLRTPFRMLATRQTA